jgi:hypothetical protein
MINELAFKYTSWAEGTPYYALMLLVIGAVTGAAFIKTNYVVKRASYLLFSAITLFIGSVLSSVWFLYVHALIHDYLWLIALVDITIWVGMGCIFMSIAKARSVDAFGKAGWAFLGFIPILGVVLVFSSSNNSSTLPEKKIIGGFFAVLLAIILTVATKSYDLYLPRMIESYTEEMSAEYSEELGVKYRSYSSQDSLSETLKLYASFEETNVMVDEITYLESVLVEGERMTYNYTITDDKITGAGEVWQDQLRDKLCLTFDEVVTRGATVEFIYVSKSHGLLATVVVSKNACN